MNSYKPVYDKKKIAICNFFSKLYEMVEKEQKESESTLASLYIPFSPNFSFPNFSFPSSGTVEEACENLHGIC